MLTLSFTVSFQFCQPDYTDAETFAVLPYYVLGDTDIRAGEGSDHAELSIFSKEQSGCVGCNNNIVDWSCAIKPAITHHQVDGKRYHKIEIWADSVDASNVGACKGIF